MGLVSLYVAVLRRYAAFRGRAARGEYWYFTIATAVIVFLLWRVDLLLGTASRDWRVGLLSGVFSLAVLLPQLAVTVRRLHDTGRSGWWMLIELVPLVGSIWLFVLLTNPSQEGDNQYGPDVLRGMR